MLNERAKLLPRLLAESRAGRVDTPLPAVPHRLRPTPADGSGAPVPLPPPPVAVVGVEEALRRRTAVRHHSGEPVGLGQLREVLALSTALDDRCWPHERAAGLPLDLYVAAWRVDALPVGLYHFDAAPRPGAEGGHLRPVAALPRGEAAEALVLQREFAKVPVVVLVTGNLAGATARHGGHGHRLLLARAGATAHAAWLAALGLGLTGTVFAGLLPAPLRTLAGFDGYRRAALFACSFGHPLEGTTG
jgi:hypothetical protein